MQQSEQQKHISEVASELRGVGFRILFFFSLTIATVIVFSPPANPILAFAHTFIWLAAALLGLNFPSIGTIVARVWVVLMVGSGIFLITQNGLVPAALSPIAAIFPCLLLSGIWRITSTVVIAFSILLILLFQTGFDEELWARLCVTNVIVSLIIYNLSSHLESQLVKSKSKSQALQQALDKEKRAHAAEMRFLATVSHEVRTPLNGILGSAEIALSKQMSEEVRADIESIQCAGETLNGILNNVLDLSALNAGKLSLRAAPVDLADVIRNVCEPYYKIALDKSITFSVNVDNGLDTRVIGDKARVMQILNNLLDNAIKFTTEGSVALNVKLLSSEAKFKMVRFSVVDTGLGMAKADAENTLHRVLNINKEESDRIQAGVGLGLQIVGHLVKMMDGSVRCESQLHSGSNFEVDIPFETTDIQHINADEADSELTFSGRILLAEDNAINQAVARSLLENIGLSVTIAQNGQQAIDIAIEGAFDLILMDIHMPNVDGAQATRTLRDAGYTKPIIAFTAAVVEDELNYALDAGMNDYITKPIDSKRLQSILRRFIEPTAYSPAKSSPSFV